MLRGSFQRAAVAVLLMVALLAPFGTCRPISGASQHSCCASEQSATVGADCCIARPLLPAVVKERVLPDQMAFAVVLKVLPLAETAASYDAAPTAVVGPHSPPPGASVLRI